MYYRSPLQNIKFSRLNFLGSNPIFQKKGKSATYTFRTPVENVYPDMGGFEEIYIKCNGYCYRAYVDQNGNLDGFQYFGKRPFDAVDYYG